MTSRQTLIERAFDIATGGKANTVREIREALKREGYPEDGSLWGTGITKQLRNLIDAAKSEKAQP